VDSLLLYTDAWRSYRGSHPAHAPVPAKDPCNEDCEDRHPAPCNTYTEAGAVLPTYLGIFWGLNRQYLPLSVATSEVMINTQRGTSHLIRRMRISHVSVHTGNA
jgi:hypothetical protein